MTTVSTFLALALAAGTSPAAVREAPARVRAVKIGAAAGVRLVPASVVAARRVDPGDLVGPGQPLVDLEGDSLELVASLSEAEARGLAVGRVVPFEASRARGEAEVVALTPGGDPLSHRRAVRARVRAVEGELRSGAFARLRVPDAGGAGDARAELWVPKTAVVERGDLSGVFVAEAGRAELRWVSLGEAVGDAVAIRAGVRAGDVVVDAPGALRDGQAVEVEVSR